MGVGEVDEEVEGVDKTMDEAEGLAVVIGPASGNRISSRMGKKALVVVVAS